MSYRHQKHQPQPVHDWAAEVIGDALESLFVWTMAMVCALFIGFLLGYTLGHGFRNNLEQTLRAAALIPLLGFSFYQAIPAYVVTGLAWYLPLYFETLLSRIIGLLLTLIVWSGVIYWIVKQTAGQKFFRY
jgi:hypothetical protein